MRTRPSARGLRRETKSLPPKKPPALSVERRRRDRPKRFARAIDGRTACHEAEPSLFFIGRGFGTLWLRRSGALAVLRSAVPSHPGRVSVEATTGQPAIAGALGVQRGAAQVGADKRGAHQDRAAQVGVAVGGDRCFT